MPNDSTCQCYHAVAAANLQCALAQCKYEIIFYEYLIYADIVNIMNILHCEYLALYGKIYVYNCDQICQKGSYTRNILRNLILKF